MDMNQFYKMIAKCMREAEAYLKPLENLESLTSFVHTWSASPLLRTFSRVYSFNIFQKKELRNGGDKYSDNHRNRTSYLL